VYRDPNNPTKHSTIKIRYFATTQVIDYTHQYYVTISL